MRIFLTCDPKFIEHLLLFEDWKRLKKLRQHYYVFVEFCTIVTTVHSLEAQIFPGNQNNDINHK